MNTKVQNYFEFHEPQIQVLQCVVSTSKCNRVIQKFKEKRFFQEYFFRTICWSFGSVLFAIKKGCRK